MNNLLNIPPVHKWFGYTRRERRSTFILLIIILVIILLRYVVPEKNLDIVTIFPGSSDSLALMAISDLKLPGEIISIDFDPNSASFDTLLKIGLDSKQARTLINYRSKGGKFRKPSDLRKVYGIDSLKSEKLIAHVLLAPATHSGPDLPRTAIQERPRLNINTCDSLSLVALPGIGPVLSVRIIKYRNRLGGYARVEQLREVYGLPPETFEIISDRVFTDSTGIRKIKINSGGFRELIRIPYIEKYEVTTILKFRELKGRIEGINDLVENKLVTGEKAEKMRAYLLFE